MTLADKTRAELAAWPAFSGGGRALAVEQAGQRLACELAALDTLACAFTRFELHAETLASAGIERLRAVSEDLSRRLTYLLEPIAPIEVDAEQCVVQMRSHPPQRDEQRTSYYELLVRRGGDLSLCRWTRAAGEVRQPLPAQVTREVFLRLVGDFSAAASHAARAVK